ncbi:MAG: apolipoprotein N-acyltransferase [Gammaproteobacteria bacterium]|nr:MAG: apolipoprotein N-acyltransferase [Gammaproteobacteria bacterium]
MLQGPYRRPLYLLLAFVAGAATVLAFAPFGQGWVPFFTVALLFTLWQRASPRAAFLIGWSWGAGLMGFGVFWLHNSIAQFGGLNLPLAVAITLLFALALALFYGAVGWVANRFLPPGKVRLLLGYPALWVLVEWLRSWLFTGFTWLSLGYSQVDTPLAGFAPLLGVYGLGLLVTGGAALLTAWRSGWIALLPLLFLAGWGLQQQEWNRPAGPSFTVALVQPNIPQVLKWRPEQFEPTLELLMALSREHPEAELVIWPETAVPAFADQVESAVLEPLHRLFGRERRTLLLGIAVREADGRYYNAMIKLGASGRGRYFKRHLVPFGEYMPLKPLLRPLIDLLAIPMSEFSAGEEARQLLELDGYPAGISICYEDTFGEEVARALPEAAFLVNASNDAWFGDSLAPHQHLEMARLRALETGRYLLRATNTGISAIIDEQGRVVGRLEQFRKGVVAGKVEPRQGMTPYARWPDWPVVLLALFMLGLGFSASVKGARPPDPAP